MQIHTLTRLAEQLTDDGRARLIACAEFLLGDPTLVHQPQTDAPRLRLVVSRVEGDSVTRPKGAYFRNANNGDAIEISDALARWLDTTPDLLLNIGWHRFMEPEDLERVRALWAAAYVTHEGFSATLRARTATGRIVYGYMRVRPWVNRQTGEFEGFIGTVHPQLLPVEHQAPAEAC